MSGISSPPTFRDVLLARRLVSRYLPRTPLHHYPSLSKLLDAEAYVKHENYHLIGSFKARGAINVVANLTDEERRQGVISASSGNHAQGVALAGCLFNTPAVLVMEVRIVHAVPGVPVGVHDHKKRGRPEVGIHPAVQSLIALNRKRDFHGLFSLLFF